MFFAINSQTKKKVNSLTVEEDSSYNFISTDIWYADPDEIESCPDNININEIIVKFREGSSEIINFKGTKYFVSPHFYIPNKSKLGINTIPESKEHKLAKSWIYNQIKKKNLSLNYSKISKPYKYPNQINLFELPIDYSKVGIETSCSSFGGRYLRRADIIVPFICKHPLFGKGIVFEIQFSRQRKSTTIDRTLDWVTRGYSISWLWEKDFEHISESLIELKEDSVDVGTFASLIKENNRSFIKNLRYEVQELSRKLEWKKEEIINEIQKEKNKILEINDNLIKQRVELIIDDLTKNKQPVCPKCKVHMILKRGIHGKFWGCFNYPYCKNTMEFLE